MRNDIFKAAAAMFVTAVVLIVVGFLVGRASAARRPTPAMRYAQLFKSTYNKEARTNRWPYRIRTMRCAPSKVKGYYDCLLKITPASGKGKALCGEIVIDTGFDVLENHLVNCKTSAATEA